MLFTLLHYREKCKNNGIIKILKYTVNQALMSVCHQRYTVLVLFDLNPQAGAYNTIHVKDLHPLVSCMEFPTHITVQKTCHLIFDMSQSFSTIRFPSFLRLDNFSALFVFQRASCSYTQRTKNGSARDMSSSVMEQLLCASQW